MGERKLGKWLAVCFQTYTGKAYCSLDDKDLVAGKSELVGLAKSSNHIRQSKSSAECSSMRAFLKTTKASTIKAEMNTVVLIARKKISFIVLDRLLSTLHYIPDDSPTIKDMTCGRTKGTYLLTECLSVNAHEKLVQSIKAAKGISILRDKATDVSMEKVFCVNVRFLPSDLSEPVTKLLFVFSKLYDKTKQIHRICQDQRWWRVKMDLPWWSVSWLRCCWDFGKY